jgi:hypothetical protein
MVLVLFLSRPSALLFLAQRGQWDAVVQKTSVVIPGPSFLSRFFYIFVYLIWSRLRVIYVSLASLSFDIDASTETVCTVLGTTVPSNYFCSSQLQSLHACIRVAHHSKNSPRSACFRLGIRTHQKLLALLAALLQHSLQRCFFSNRSLSL